VHALCIGAAARLHSLRAAPISPRSIDASGFERAAESRPNPIRKETEMPKMKTKSGAKKRFKVTATGRILVAQAGKRHGMIKRSTKFIRQARGTTTLSAPDEKIVKSYMPYAR
jgi:large subunit ribosomal protein L35